MRIGRFIAITQLTLLLPWLSQAVEPTLSDIRPMALAGEQQQIIDQALIDLVRGDTKSLESLPITAFLAPIARPDANNSGLSFRWTMSLPKALARLPDNQRKQTLARLDARYHTLLTPNLSTHDRTRLAVAFLPAPTALEHVQYAANLAFDRGHLTDFLGITQLIPIQYDDARRQSVALLLSGLGPEVDTTLQLTPPGTAIPTTTTTTTPPAAHLAIRWVVQPGWVLAVDPFEQVAWQYSIDRNATVVTGPGAALIRDSLGVRVLNDSGFIKMLTPLPSGAQLLCVAGGAAWFATGTRGWRMNFADGQVTALDLGVVPIGAPVVRGQKSLWLTAHSFLLFDAERLIHRFQHQLPVAGDWKLSSATAQVQLQAPDGRQWHLSAFTEQLKNDDVQQQAELLLRAHRFDDALKLLSNFTDEHAPSLRLRAQIGLAFDKNIALPDFSPNYPPADQALILSAHFANSDRGIGHVLHKLPATDLFTYFDTLSQQHPTVQFSTDTHSLIDQAQTWNHIYTTSAWAQWRQRKQYPRSQIPTVNTTSIELPINTKLITSRDAHGHLLWDDRQFRLERTPDVMIVMCHGKNGDLLWRHQWRPMTYSSAPSQFMDIRDNVVYVHEGTARVIVLDVDLGVQLGVFPLTDTSGTVYFLSPTQLAQLGPLGVNNVLTLYDVHGRGLPIPLATPARWACNVGGHLILRLTDLTAVAYPGAKSVMWPLPLLRQPQAPLVTAEGLHASNALWPWMP